MDAFFLPVASFCMGLGGAWHVRVGSHGTGAGGSAFGVVLARWCLFLRRSRSGLCVAT